MAAKTQCTVVRFPTPRQREQRFWNRVFTQYVEDTITDEQVERVLAPVLPRIRAGAFDRPQRERREVSLLN